jgi:malonate decarboxylase alpha subunit
MFVAVILLCVFPDRHRPARHDHGSKIMNAPARSWNTLQANRAAAWRAPARRWATTWTARRCRRPHRRPAAPVLECGDRVCLEGEQPEAGRLPGQALAGLDPARINGLHMLQSVLALPEHLDVFERGVAARLDFSFSGPQAARVAKLVRAGKLEIGAIHTYLELFGRYFVDLTPRVALVAAEAADRHGNLYTGPNTEDTPAIVEATAFKSGIVIVQVNRIVDTLPRVDIPATGSTSWCSRRRPITSNRCSRATRRRSPRSRC